MRQTLMTAALACASMLVAAPKADAQVFYRPWLRPRVVVVPPRFVGPIGVPRVIVQAAPPVYYPSPYYYPQAPQVYVQPAPPPVYIQPPAPQVYIQSAPQPPIYQAPTYAPPVVQAPPPPMYQAPYQTPYQAPYQGPPVYQAPPPPVYSEPPMYQAPPPPVYATRPVFRAPILPGWTAKFGIGFRFAALVNSDQYTKFSQLGFGGELLFRVHRHLVLEMAGEYQKRVDSGFDRYDVPVTLGMRVHIGAPDWVVSPYLVVAGGGVYSNLDYLHANDTAWFVDGQLGGGLEIRVGRHLALTADVRGDARHRVTDPDAATLATTSVDGKPFAPMASSLGVQGRLGAALYF